MLRLLAIPLGLIVLVIASLYWSGSSVTKRADFTFINRGDIITLDLNLMSYQQDFRLTHGIREGLYEYHWDTQQAIHGGAESEEFSPDGKVWTFHLRKNAKWSNGDPVTARDYVFSWRRLLEEPGEYTYLFYYIRNGEEYEKSYSAGEPIATKEIGMEAVDDFTFRVTLNDPVPYMKDLMAFPPFYPRHERSMAPFRVWSQKPVMEAVRQSAAAAGRDLNRMTFEEVLAEVRTLSASNPQSLSEADRETLATMARTGKIGYTFNNEYTRPPHVVTNGPFNLTDWQFKRRLWLEKSPTYWNRDEVNCNSIEMIVNENVLSQFLQYEADTVDWLADVTPDLASELFKRGRKDLRTCQAFGTAFLTLLVTPNLPQSIHGGMKNPLADVRVRQALAMSINRKFVTEEITRMGETEATTYFPPGSLPGFEVKPGFSIDVEKAKKLLAEAGYPDGRGFPVLPILYNSENPIRARMAQALKQQWKQNLGIDVEIESLEVKIYRDRVTKKNYGIAIVAWYGDYPDVSTFTDKYLSTSLQNDSGWANPRYDELLSLAKKEPDQVKRLGYLLEAETLLDFEVPIIPIYHYVNCWMFGDAVQGLKANSRNQSDFKSIRVVNN